MVRRCKSYLTNLVIIDAESELDKMSLDCEPQASGGSFGILFVFSFFFRSFKFSFLFQVPPIV